MRSDVFEANSRPVLMLGIRLKSLELPFILTSSGNLLVGIVFDMSTRN